MIDVCEKFFIFKSNHSESMFFQPFSSLFIVDLLFRQLVIPTIQFNN